MSVIFIHHCLTFLGVNQWTKSSTGLKCICVVISFNSPPLLTKRTTSTANRRTLASRQFSLFLPWHYCWQYKVNTVVVLRFYFKISFTSVLLRFGGKNFLGCTVYANTSAICRSLHEVFLWYMRMIVSFTQLSGSSSREFTKSRTLHWMQDLKYRETKEDQDYAN